MRYVTPALLLLLCLLTLLFPGLTLSSTREALSLFFESVLPALFPFYVLTSMLCRTALFARLEERSRAAVPLCFLLGGLAGYPTGARLSAALGKDALAAGCNLCSPMFLLGVVSVSLYGNAAMFPVLAISHYGTAALFLLLFCLLGDTSSDGPVPSVPAVQKSGSFITDIGDGMLAMLRIGGCVLFFYVMAKLLSRVLPFSETSFAPVVLSGLFEMTAGCAMVGSLNCPVRVSAGLYAFFVSFGGLSVFAQSVMTAELRNPGRYLFQKLLQGFSAALAAYFLAPLFLRETVTAASMTAQDYRNNALLCFAFFGASCLGLCGSYLLAHLLNGLHRRFSSKQ